MSATGRTRRGELPALFLWITLPALPCRAAGLANTFGVALARAASLAKAFGVALAEAAWRRRIPALFLWLGSTRPAPGAIFPPRSPALPTASPLTSDLRPLSSGLRPLILSF